MKKFLQVLLLEVMVMMFTASFASSNPKDIIKKGTKLVYDVNYSGSNYEFTVTLKDYSDDYSFDWNMSAPINKNGSVHVSKDAVENGTGVFNYFTDESANIVNQCYLIVSKKMYDIFKENGTMGINTNMKTNELTLFGSPYDHTQNFGYKNDFSYEFDCRTVSNDDDDYQITYVNNPNFPLIVEMKLDWSLRLKRIIN